MLIPSEHGSSEAMLAAPLNDKSINVPVGTWSMRAPISSTGYC